MDDATTTTATITTTTITSSDAAAIDDRRGRNLEQLMLMMVIHYLLPKEGDDDDDAQLDQMKDMVKELSMSINGRGDQSALSKKELLAIIQQLLDAQLRSLGGGENVGRVMESSSASDHQLMETAAAAKKKEKAAAAKKMKKKRNKRNKAAAKHKGTKRMSWLGGGIISLLMMAAAFGSSIMTLSHIPQSDGSSGGKAPPTLPPSTSTSLRQRDLQSSDNIMSSMSPSSVSPLAVVVQAPIFLPADDVSNNRRMNSVDERALSTCFDTPNYKDINGYGCKLYEDNDEPGCPILGIFYEGNMGVANDNCCYCGGGSHTLPPTSPKPSSSPTKSATPSSSPSSAPSTCTDTEGWYDFQGYDCSWYEVMDVPGCPQYGSQTAYFVSTAKGSANDNCCYCKNDAVSTVSPSVAPSSSEKCVDTPGWKGGGDRDCFSFSKADDPGCPYYGHSMAGEMGPAAENCCYCKDPTCEDYNWKCQDYITDSSNDWWTYDPDRVKGVCDEAASCSCETADHLKIVTNPNYGFNETVGLYNECKCDFWLRLCEETRGGDTCDYAAEYCCGDYRYYEDDETFEYLNRPLCYCDFFNFTQRKFGHTLKPKALNINKEFSNPCDQNNWNSTTEEERESLEQIYEKTNGQNWTNNAGWMNETVAVDRCQWYGVSCDVDGFVTSIDLRDNNLVGQFPVYSRKVDYWGPILDNYWQRSKYGLANLYKLKRLDLSKNKLTGTIEYGPLYNLNALAHFDVSGNQLSGEVEALVSPSLTYADFSDNSFTSARFKKYKESFLQYCDMSNNAITTAPLSLCLERSVNKEFDLADVATLCPPDRNALHDFYVLANGAEWTNGSLWLDENANYCDWKGVTCNVKGHVIELNLANNGLSGRLSESIGNLTFIEVLDLSDNDIKGFIPTEIGLLSNLNYLRLSYNAFTGTLPTSLNNLPKLRQFNMSSNALNGDIPGLIGFFDDSTFTLQELDISNQTNGLSGEIPENIWRFQSLKILNLAGNRLNGTIPSTVGMLEGSLKHLDLSNNRLTGSIPSQIGLLQGASVFLRDNRFYNSSTTAPLSLCVQRVVKECDLADDTTLCPPERIALSNFYDSAKGAEWTDRSNWTDEYASYCDWNGVTCDNNNNTKHVTKLQLSNNGLSGRLSESIGNLTFIEVLDLSDNDIKGSIPTEIGKLKHLKYLRLSYNAFTGAAPVGLGEMKGLQLLQLQSNRITEMPNIPQLNDSLSYNKSTFVTDCGAPSAFDEALRCDNCTMCCNAHDDCHPQEKTKIAPLNYGTFAALVFGCFIVFCYIAAFILYKRDRSKNLGNDPPTTTETRIREDEDYALSKIGKDSVYSYFVTEKVLGWLAAFATVGMQIGILVVFILASEPKLQDDKSDIQYTWKCPRDTDECKNKSDLDNLMWAIFCVLMAAFLAKDMISGSKLIYHSAKVRHPLGSRIRYFFGGVCLCGITLFALYVSTVYNIAIATRNTELILNSFVVLFIMDMDEWIFSALTAWNEKWTAHAEDSTLDEMKEQIASQQEEMESKIDEVKEEMNKEIERQKAQIATQQEELRRLRELVENVLQSQAAAAAITTTTTTASDSESVSDCGSGSDTNAVQMEQVDEITMPINADAEQTVQEPQAAAAAAAAAASKPDSERNGDTDEDLQE